MYSSPLPIFNQVVFLLSCRTLSDVWFTNSFMFFACLRFKSSLHILDINSLSDISLVSIFSHSLYCLFTLLIAQILNIFMKYNLPTFYPVACFVDVISKKSLTNPILWSFYSLFSSKSFIVSGLTLRSLICFELIFDLMLNKGLTSFFAMWIYNFPSFICWKDCPFPIEWSWHPCKKSFDCICEDLSLSFYFIPLVNICLYSSTMLFWLL